MIERGTRVVISRAEFCNGMIGTVRRIKGRGAKFGFVVEIDGKGYPLAFHESELTTLPNQNPSN